MYYYNNVSRAKLTKEKKEMEKKKIDELKKKYSHKQNDVIFEVNERALMTYKEFMDYAPKLDENEEFWREIPRQYHVFIDDKYDGTFPTMRKAAEYVNDLVDRAEVTKESGVFSITKGFAIRDILHNEDVVKIAVAKGKIIQIG